MNFDLSAALPLLLPKAIAWAEERSEDIANTGRDLNEHELRIATAMGVSNPKFIRLKMVDSLPLPTDPLLRQAAIETGLLGPNMVGMTFGHGIYICLGHLDTRLFSHECRHVYQYEQAGSIAAFIPAYLREIVEFGYANAPLENDARNYEIRHIA